MNQILSVKQVVHTESSNIPCEVERFLGGGGQGEVYLARLGRSPVALKWYFPSSATNTQRETLNTLIKKGPPNDKFLWPMELVEESKVIGFGYIMPLRGQGYHGIVDMMKRRVEPSFRALAVSGMQLSDSFFQLHAKGLCYRDISFGNVFINPLTGDILICDNDNVTIDGHDIGGIKGTPRFMAPEVVRDEAPPSTQTDLFSLAILMFYMFMLHHPLEGIKETSIKCFDLYAMTKIYGTEPLFIFDPDDDSNRPDPNYHQVVLNFWPIYPQFLRDLFTRSFTDGIREPQSGRVRETQWRAAMARLCDSIIYCSNCSAENFYDIDTMKKSGGTLAQCWACKKDLNVPPRILIGKNIVMLNHNSQLYARHIDPQKSCNSSECIAQVMQHPKDHGIWGLRNLSSEKWVITTGEGKTQDVYPGRSFTLAVGTKVNFGRKEGKIRI